MIGSPILLLYRLFEYRKKKKGLALGLECWRVTVAAQVVANRQIIVLILVKGGKVPARIFHYSTTVHEKQAPSFRSGRVPGASAEQRLCAPGSANRYLCV